MAGAKEGCKKKRIAVGSGLVVGALGRAGDMLDRFGFIFLEEIVNIEAEIDGDITARRIEDKAGDEDMLVNASDTNQQHTQMYNWTERLSYSLQVTRGHFMRDGWYARVPIRVRVASNTSAQDGDNWEHHMLNQEMDHMVSGAETTIETPKEQCINVVVPPSCQVTLQYRVGTSASSERRGGHWIVTTASGTRTFEFHGHLFISETYRNFSSAKTPL
ncbi:hypothetical protein Poli38472_004809 [Pythium oligandrum]|uniref:Uncharacterized protein n=1 Tax=Pythium oligandrum TaxID=41045 RepID=A0A8K1CAX1_PYTOL|nr:hypothetical protein Poli38472_004809 [Pythium oligandrum]|eukprot:TMW59740.1 hypothetical protein Poli38472_004809 [Pythium oligandrum]